MGHDAVPKIITAPGAEDWQVRIQAAVALGVIDPEARTAGPALRNLLQDEDNYLGTKTAMPCASYMARSRPLSRHSCRHSRIETRIWAAMPRKVRSAGGRLVLCRVTPRIEELLQVPHPADLLLLCADEREAVRSFA